MCHVIEHNGPPSWTGNSSMLRVVESRSRYSARKVMFVRVFDPVRAAARGDRPAIP
jgi:hypothetical protein